MPLLIVTIAHSVQWYRAEQREAKRYDRREERSGDQDLQAYNDMLAGLSERRSDFGQQEYYGADYEEESVQSQFHTDKSIRKKNARRKKQKFTDLPSPEHDIHGPGSN